MNTQNMNWKLLNSPFNQGLNDALKQQYHATQFIAMVGRHLIPQEADDSNTNMQYLPDQELLAGNKLSSGLRLALHLTDLKLCFLDQAGKCKNGISLIGKSKLQVFEELKKTLSDLGIDVSKFKNELHYEIPAHDLDSGSSFSINNRGLFQENTNYRYNAELIMNNLTTLYPNTSSVRVWPHHYDTGFLLSVAYNEKGELSKSIGLGWAIPDGMVNEPYYYLSFWSGKSDNNLKILPELPAGQWMIPNWNGGILMHSDILKAGSASEQHELVKSFYHSGINMIMDHF
ncbi:MAG: hypothetical protein DRI73_00370 [Bacteroidetes bacterium]|nr:MAG: hypothetical protein DRI73_00370 [Bacteroidota bacterium]